MLVSKAMHAAEQATKPIWWSVANHMELSATTDAQAWLCQNWLRYVGELRTPSLSIDFEDTSAQSCSQVLSTLATVSGPHLRTLDIPAWNGNFADLAQLTALEELILEPSDDAQTLASTLSPG